MAPPTLQFAFRTQKQLDVLNAAPSYQRPPNFSAYEGTSRCCAYSPCGRYFAWASPDTVTVHDTTTGKPIFTLPIPIAVDITFSPRGTYLVTLERPSKDAAGDATKNLKVWEIRNEGQGASPPTPLGQFVQKATGEFNIQYTADEKYCTKLATNEVQFFLSTDFTQAALRLRVEGVAQYLLSPGLNTSVAVYIPSMKGHPASVRVYRLPQFQSPVSQKTFFKGDKVKMEWNRQGTSVLIHAQTDVDKSNKSYYGESTLYLLSSTGGFEGRITLDKEGPIHYVSWSPNSKEFGVVYGFMPSKTTIFNARATAIHTFPIAPRNEIRFSPSGAYALVAGLGNLAGQIDIYHLEKDYRKLATIDSGNPSVCEWSPDSQYIMTATLSPRLRVDNGVKLWHISGKLMYNQDMQELYHIAWRPSDPEAFPRYDALSPVAAAGTPTPHESALQHLATAKTPSKPVGAYRPPGARGTATPLLFRREDEGGAAHGRSNGSVSESYAADSANGFGARPRRTIPGAEPVEKPGRVVPGAQLADGSTAAGTGSAKNKRKRNKKKEAAAAAAAAQEQDDEEGGCDTEPNGGVRLNGSSGDAAAAAAAAVAGGDESLAGLTEEETMQRKKIRSLQKKLRAIEDLEVRHRAGDKLEDTQIKKMGNKKAVQQELAELGAL